MKRLSIFSEYSLPDLEAVLEPLVRRVIKSELQAIKLDTKETQTEEKYLTRKEVSSLLKLSLPTISKYTKTGILKGKVMGGSYRYMASDVYKFFNDKRSFRT